MDPDQSQQVQPPINNPQAPVNFLLLIIVALASALISSGATYLLLNSQKNVSQTKTVVQSPTPTPDPTANWKTYKYSLFSIKVPPEWQAGSSNTKDFAQLKLQLEPNNTLLKTEINTEKTSQDLESYVEKIRQESKKFSQAANALPNYKTDWKLTPTTIDNQPTIKVQDFEAYPNDVVYYVKDPTKKWVIGIVFFNFGPNMNTDKELFDQILSTFKFTQ